MFKRNWRSAFQHYLLSPPGEFLIARHLIRTLCRACTARFFAVRTSLGKQIQTVSFCGNRIISDDLHSSEETDAVFGPTRRDIWSGVTGWKPSPASAFSNSVTAGHQTGSGAAMYFRASRRAKLTPLSLS